MSDQYNEKKPLYGSSGIDTYLKFIAQKYPYVNINELLEHAEMKPYQVQDQGHLFSQRQINRFYTKLVELTGNNHIAREAGRFASSPVVFNNAARLAIGFISPVKFYQLVGKYVTKISKASKYEANILGPNKVEIIVTQNPGTREEPFQCENRIGYWEAVSSLFKLKLPTIEHPECLFKGGKTCRYIVSWPKSPLSMLKIIRNISLSLLTLMCIIFSVIYNLSDQPQVSVITFVTLYAIITSLVLALNWYIKKLESNNLEETIDILRNSSDELTEQININYENSLLINEVANILANYSDTQALFSETVQVLHKRLNYDRILVMLANPEKDKLIFQSGFGYNKEQKIILQNLTFSLKNPDSKGIFYLSFRNKKPILINDISEVKDDLSERSYEFATQMNAKSLICCPIIYEEEVLGILAVDNIKSTKPLLQRDLNLLMGIALQLGSRLHNIKIETYLRQVQKMEAVGNLAGGVAHDFNNILTTILGYSQMLTMQIPSDDPRWKMVDNIHHAGLKAASLTHQLLAFSRKQVLEMQVTNLNMIVEDMNKMLGRLIGEDITIKTYLAPSIHNIMGDPSQLGQVLMNLVVNARDAMPKGGQITIETGNIFLEETYVQKHKGLKAGHYSLLSVTDTGHGMSPELREKIFEPFFTTKSVGKGTGLGLSTVYGIVKQHKGNIYVYSEPEYGTSFKIYLPKVDKDIKNTKNQGLLINKTEGNETILVVDDDESIRDLIIDTLSPQGYNIITASSGEEALNKCGASDRKIDLVLSDVIMPGMNGVQLVDTMRELCPEVKTILMSGYTDNIISQHGLDRSHYILMNKPLLPISLATKIREVLDNDSKKTELEEEKIDRT